MGREVALLLCGINYKLLGERAPQSLRAVLVIAPTLAVTLSPPGVGLVFAPNKVGAVVREDGDEKLPGLPLLLAVIALGCARWEIINDLSQSATTSIGAGYTHTRTSLRPGGEKGCKPRCQRALPPRHLSPVRLAGVEPAFSLVRVVCAFTPPQP